MSCYCVKAENNDSYAVCTIRSGIDPAFREYYIPKITRRKSRQKGPRDVVESHGSRFIVESFATMPRKTNRLFSNFVTPTQRVLGDIAIQTRKEKNT